MRAHCGSHSGRATATTMPATAITSTATNESKSFRFIEVSPLLKGAIGPVASTLGNGSEAMRTAVKSRVFRVPQADKDARCRQRYVSHLEKGTPEINSGSSGVVLERCLIHPSSQGRWRGCR